MEKQPLSKPMNCEGAQKATVIGVVEWTMMARVGFAPPRVQTTPSANSEGRSPALQECRRREPSEKYLDAKFYLMENLSDPVILGRPELQELGLYLEPADDDGRLWVQFSAYGTRLPVIQPKLDGARRVFRVDQPVVLQGPDLQDVPVVISEQDYEFYTH